MIYSVKRFSKSKYEDLCLEVLKKNREDLEKKDGVTDKDSRAVILRDTAGKLDKKTGLYHMDGNQRNKLTQNQIERLVRKANK